MASEDDAEDTYFHRLFSGLRSVLPPVDPRLVDRITERVSGLQDPERLRSPALDGAVGQLAVQLLNLVSSWLGDEGGDAPRDGATPEEDEDDGRQ